MISVNKNRTLIIILNLARIKDFFVTAFSYKGPLPDDTWRRVVAAVRQWRVGRRPKNGYGQVPSVLLWPVIRQGSAIASLLQYYWKVLRVVVILN